MLEIKNLNKSYGQKKVLNGIECRLENGIYGLLGPNGAGKSTLMNLITTNLKPDSGEILWKGKNINEDRNEYLSSLGYMPQQQGLYNGFTGAMFLNYIACLKDLPKQKIKEEVTKAINNVNLSDCIDKKIASYSGGMKQRLLIAGAVIGDPELIIFDEPTAGLDPKERVRVKNMLKSLAKDKIILVATHIVPDIEDIAEEVLILKDGMLLPERSAKTLIETMSPNGNLEDVYMSIFTEEEKYAASKI